MLKFILDQGIVFYAFYKRARSVTKRGLQNGGIQKTEINLGEQKHPLSTEALL